MPGQIAGLTQRSIAMKTQLGIMMLIAAMAASPLVGSADDTPPKGSLTLYDVTKLLESNKYGPIVDVSFDDGYWEVEVFKGEAAFEVLVDPLNGAIIAEHRDEAEALPPDGSQPLSKIAATLMGAGYTDLNDASYEGRSWEIEARSENVKRELRVDPATGDIISDRSDD
jgi:hypothetical protein